MVDSSQDRRIYNFKHLVRFCFGKHHKINDISISISYAMKPVTKSRSSIDDLTASVVVVVAAAVFGAAGVSVVLACVHYVTARVVVVVAAPVAVAAGVSAVLACVENVTARVVVVVAAAVVGAAVVSVVLACV